LGQYKLVNIGSLLHGNILPLLGLSTISFNWWSNVGQILFYQYLVNMGRTITASILLYVDWRQIATNILAQYWVFIGTLQFITLRILQSLYFTNISPILGIFS
jgi:hypothetical protein